MSRTSPGIPVAVNEILSPPTDSDATPPEFLVLYCAPANLRQASFKSHGIVAYHAVYTIFMF